MPVKKYYDFAGPFFYFQSGAVLALVGATCTMYPNAQLSIIGLDQIVPHSFSAENVITSLNDLLSVSLCHGYFFCRRSKV